MKTELPESFVDDLANTVFTQENIDRANQYLKTRGLNPSILNFPWTASSADISPFLKFKALDINPSIYTEVLYIPILEIDSTPENPKLAGFDIRYLGEKPYRHRWTKRKRTETTSLIYNIHAVKEANSIIVTESAMDAESFRTCGYEAVGALTALKSTRFIQFLYSLADKVYLAYDNDTDGKNATKTIIEYQSKFDVPPVIIPFVYPMKDPNKALETLGVDQFRAAFEYQFV